MDDLILASVFFTFNLLLHGAGAGEAVIFLEVSLKNNFNNNQST